MTRQRARITSQTLAAAVTFAAVLIMLAPLRRSPMRSASRQAGWTPLPDLGGMVDTAAFHRLGASATPYAASPRALCRLPTPAPAPVP